MWSFCQQLCCGSVREYSAGSVSPHLSLLNQRSELLDASDIQKRAHVAFFHGKMAEEEGRKEGKTSKYLLTESLQASFSLWGGNANSWMQIPNLIDIHFIWIFAWSTSSTSKRISQFSSKVRCCINVREKKTQRELWEISVSFPTFPSDSCSTRDLDQCKE